MDLHELIVDPACATALGRYGESLVAQSLHRGVCLTCRQPVGQREQISLRVDLFEERFAYATIHHPACQRSCWQEADVDMFAEVWSTYSLTYFLAPVYGTEMTLAMVNPSLEVMLLLPGHDGGYYPALHPQFFQVGMARNSRLWPPPLIDGVTVSISAQGTPVLRMPSGRLYPHDESFPVPQDVTAAVRDQGKMVFIVTHAVDPQAAADFDDTVMNEVLDHQLTRVAMVPLVS